MKSPDVSIQRYGVSAACGRTEEAGNEGNMRLENLKIPETLFGGGGSGGFYRFLLVPICCYRCSC